MSMVHRKVWERWCTVRNIRPGHPIANSVRAYVSVVAAPPDEAAAAATLQWERPPRDDMFARRIQSWSPPAKVREDLRAFQGV
jgi:hypothetical protein